MHPNLVLQHATAGPPNALVRSRVTPFHHTLELFIGPGIKIHGFDSANMRAHAPVNPGATNADKNTQIPGSPSRI